MFSRLSLTALQAICFEMLRLVKSHDYKNLLELMKNFSGPDLRSILRLRDVRNNSRRDDKNNYVDVIDCLEECWRRRVERKDKDKIIDSCIQPVLKIFLDLCPEKMQKRVHIEGMVCSLHDFILVNAQRESIGQDLQTRKPLYPILAPVDIESYQDEDPQV